MLALEFIGFTYVTNFLTTGLEQVIFDVFDSANRLFRDWGLPVRFLYLDSLTLEPGYLITIRTPEGSINLYPLEVLVDFLDYRLKVEMEKNDGLEMNKIFGITSFPLASRNRYFDFYESFLGYQTERLDRRIMVLSMRPFESDVLRVALRVLESPHEDEMTKKLAKMVVRREMEILRSRLLKGILHEVGHAFGLGHCSNSCVMNPPRNIWEWDTRPVAYCDSCWRKLRRGLNEASGDL
ncbi:peptidase M54 [Thermococcus sp.]|uniref:peptidase M54 n=1 Tax=Thermococcus sp. TaxID=35749 RepID=UPI0034588AD9